MTMFYKIIITIFYPLIYLFLKKRQRKGKESADPKIFAERFGVVSVVRPDGDIIWFHGASLGELNSAMSFMSDMLVKYPNAKILMTYCSSNADKVVRVKFKDNPNYICQYLPVDVPFCVERFMKYWKPTIGFFVDSEFWPSLLSSAKKNGVPMFLLNGRITEKSFKSFSNPFAKILFREMMSAFTYVFTASAADEKRFVGLLDGYEKAKVKNFENLKYSASAPVCDKAKFDEVMSMIGKRPAWVCGSTHTAEGKVEEEYVFTTHRELLKQYPDALVVICPRQSSRMPEILEVAKKYNFKCAVRSRGEKISADTNVYIADTLGEMGIFYSVTDTVFVGRSLVNLGGSNPIEPMQLKSCTIFGRYYENFQDMVEEMIEKQVVVGVKDGSQLTEVVLRCFDKKNAADVQDIIKRSYDFVMSKANVKEKIFAVIQPICEQRLRK